ncbi:MAG: hypothetical protein ISR76_06740 [Planctomycetes bacterium]|nr:hypothetical protein [Planctomycetota bacterium]
MVLVFCTMISGLALTFGGASQKQRDVARDVTAELRSDLAAQSGLEFAQRQLMLDSDWAGTGLDGVTLASGLHFDVQRLDAGGETTLQVDGTHGRSLARLEAQVLVEDGGGTTYGDKALVFLGRSLDLAHVHIHGDMLLADTTGVVDDWINGASGTGSWQPGGPPSIDGIDFDKFYVWDGTLFKYTDRSYSLKKGDQQQISERTQMPAWNLSSWAIDGPGKLIHDGTGGGSEDIEISHVHTTSTLVVISNPGQAIHIANSHIDGGIVIWCEDTWPIRDSGRNQVHVENCHVGDGQSPHIGILSPAADQAVENCHLTGFSMVRSLDKLQNDQILGQMVVVDSLDIENVHITYDPLIGSDPPSGISFPTSASGVTITGIREAF